MNNVGLPIAGFEWGRRDSNPQALRHMILSHARLPVPTLPREADSDSNGVAAKVNQVNQKVNQKLTSDILSDFLTSRREGISHHTLLFYHRCLGKAISIELTPQGINAFLSGLDCDNGKHAYFRAIRAFCHWATK